MDGYPVLSAYCVIVQDGEVLLSQDLGKVGFKLPGGKILPCEAVPFAAIREAKEETGLDIKLDSLLEIHEFIKSKEYRVRIYFLAHAVGGIQQAQSGEVARLKWVSQAALSQLTSSDFYLPTYYLAVKAYLSGRRYPLNLIRSAV